MTARHLLAGCLLAVGAALLAGCGGEPADEGPLLFPGKGLLLISVDTLRADRLGSYGYDRDTTPELDAFAEECVLFEEMYAHSPKTASSHMSLLTGLLPTVHKVRNKSARLGLVSPVLAKNRLALAQILNRAGYWNACIAGGGNIAPDMGFGRGFQGRFESALWDVSRLADRAAERLEEGRASGKPPFVFLHTYQVHGPYLPPPGFEKRFAPDPSPIVGSRVALYRDLPFNKQWSIMNRGPGGDETKAYWYGKEHFDEREAGYLSDLYDGEVAYTDQELGRFLDGLRESGQLDELIVVITSDHGEEFLEHGSLEHDQLYRELLHVPFLVRLPGGRKGGTRVQGLAGLVDVLPTVLELLDLEAPTNIQGRSLVPAMESGRTQRQTLVAERVMFPDDYKATLRSEDTSVLFHAVPGRLEGYDLDGDPGETTDVMGSLPRLAKAAEALKRNLAAAFQLRDVLDEEDAGGTVEITPEQVQQMLELGYVDQQGELPPLEGTPLSRWPEDG